MSEVDLSVLAQSGRHENNSARLSPMQEVNAALKECGFGLFHVRLLCTTLAGIVTGVLTSGATAYLLPSAECDLKMDLLQKGLLNAIPYVGMLCSSLIAGFLVDTFGRKVFICLGYGGIFLFKAIAGSSQTYSILVTATFFEGLLFATAFSAAITLTSEFCHDGIRDRVLLCQSSFASVSQILIAAMSWGILINDWHFSFYDGWFVLNTWNFYLFLMSLWALTAFVSYIFIPESPKYLVTQNKFDEARAVLIKIYKENTRNPEDKFLYKDLWKKSSVAIPEVSKHEKKMTLAHHLVVGLHNIKPMFQKPLVVYLVLICTMNFFCMCLYNVLRLWYPQVSTIVEHSTFTTEDGENKDLCDVLDTYTRFLGTRQNSTTPHICVAIKSGSETYINSIIIGVVCTVPYFISGVLVNKIGKKPLLVVAALIAFSVTLGLRFSNSKSATVALFALVIAISQMLMSLNQAIVIEFFPTTTRTLAISMMMMTGRIGTLAGNISFPLLLKMGCVIPFYSLASMMLCVVTMSLFLPAKKK